MAYFPLFTDISNRCCLVAGGGNVACRKVKTLLKYGAAVRVVSEEICEELRNTLPKESLRFGQVHEKEIREAFLVVAATSSREQNHRISRHCHQYGIPVNVADSPEESSFLFPAIVRKGEISIGINSGTGSPAVSKKLREEIEKVIPDCYADISDWMGEIRKRVKTEIQEENERRRILKTVAKEAFCAERILTEEEVTQIIKHR